MLRSLFLCVPLLLLANVACALALPPCPGPNILAWHSCEGTYTLDNGDRYIGEWRDSLPNGQGTQTALDGSKYVGEWRNGLFNGQGTYTTSDGSKYVGGFRNGKYDGQGTMFWDDGGVWVGQWKDDEWVSGDQYTEGEAPPDVMTLFNER
jgi:hypothetical protein